MKQQARGRVRNATPRQAPPTVTVVLNNHLLVPNAVTLSTTLQHKGQLKIQKSSQVPAGRRQQGFPFII